MFKKLQGTWSFSAVLVAPRDYRISGDIHIHKDSAAATGYYYNRDNRDRHHSLSIFSDEFSSAKGTSMWSQQANLIASDSRRLCSMANCLSMFNSTVVVSGSVNSDHFILIYEREVLRDNSSEWVLQSTVIPSTNIKHHGYYAVSNLY